MDTAQKGGRRCRGRRGRRCAGRGGHLPVRSAVPGVEQGRSTPGALRQHRRLLALLRRRRDSAQEARRLHRHFGCRAADRAAGCFDRRSPPAPRSARRCAVCQHLRNRPRRPAGRRQQDTGTRDPDRPLPRPLLEPARTAVGDAVRPDAQRQGRRGRDPKPAELAGLGRRSRYQGRELRHHRRLPGRAWTRRLRVLAVRRECAQPSLEPVVRSAHEPIAPRRRPVGDRAGLLPQ